MSKPTFSPILEECCYCPECGSDWRHNAIPEDYLREGYYGEWNGEERFYGRLVGIYCQTRDRTVEWMCPDCKHRWPR